MKVLYLLNYAGHGGTENYIHLLMKRLRQNGINPYFAYNIEGKLSKRCEKEEIKAFQIKMRHPFDLIAAFQLARYCAKHDIEVVHTQYLRENYISILARIFKPDIRVVYTNHVMLYNNAVVKAFNRVLTRFNHKIIAVCQLGKKILIENNVAKDKITVIHNGVDQTIWDDAPNGRLREELEIDKQTRIIICLSRFDEFKGNRFLIESIAALKKYKDLNRYVFVLANEGPLWEEMKELTKELQVDDVIRFIGFRKDITNLLMSSDVYVNPSEWEALSFAIVEAISASLPVVSTDRGGTVDIINDDNRCGILVPYDEPEKMAEALYRVLTDQNYYRRLKEEAKRVAETKFNVVDMLEKTYQTYLNK